MQHSLAVALTLVLYQLVLLGIGLVAQRRTRDETDFYLGGRRLGPWVAALSASASSSSAWTLLGVSGAAYAWGLGALWILPACVGGFALNWLVLAPALQRLSHDGGALTATDLLAPPGSALRQPIRRIAGLMVLVAFTTYVAAQLQGAGKTFHETFGMDPEPALLLGAAIIIAYTLLGGFWAVSASDALQGAMMALASLLLPIIALIAVGGPAELFRSLPSGAYSHLARGATGPAALGFIAGLLGIGLGYPGQPHVVNRFMALRDDRRSLRTGRLVALSWAVLLYTGMLLLGLCGRVLHPGLSDPELVFITATHSLLPPVFAGIMLAAVLSAIMSTADSQLLVAASAVTHDLGLGGSEPRSRLRRSRAVVVGLSAAAIAAALWGSSEIFGKVLFAWSALGNAFGPTLLVRAISRRSLRPGAVLAAILLGFGLSVLAYLLPESRGGPAERILPFAVGLALCTWGIQRRGGVGARQLGADRLG